MIRRKVDVLLNRVLVPLRPHPFSIHSHSVRLRTPVGVFTLVDEISTLAGKSATRAHGRGVRIVKRIGMSRKFFPTCELVE